MNGFLDILERKNKKNGSFCILSYPQSYILTTFHHDSESIKSITHELGHAMHATFSKKIGYPGFLFPSVLSEIASKVHELFLEDTNLKNCSKTDRMATLEKQIHSMINTMFFTVRYHEFEYRFVEEKEKNGFVSAFELNKLSLDLWKEYFSNTFHVPNYLKYDWERNHIFFLQPPFYNWNYPFSFSIACTIFWQLKNKTLSFKKYFEFLSFGDRVSAVEQLRYLGISIEKPDFLESSFSYLESLIDNLEQELKGEN